MSSRLMVNLIEPSDIVIPDTDGGTPDTGIFSIGQGTNNVQNSNALIITVIGLVVLLTIVAIAILLIKRHKKQKLVNNLGSSYNGMTLNTKRHLVPRLAGLFVLVLITVFGFLNYNEKHMTNNVEAANNTLTVTTEDITAIDIEVEDEAAFGVGESKVTVDAATDNGYTLMAYVDSTTTSLTNSDSNDTIAMLETSYSQALTDNTWGISLTRPESQEQTVFRGLPTAEEDAMIVNVSSTNPTEAGDAVTLYYAAYVTPDLEYGTYEGATINYIAVPQVIDTDDVTVRFHGNGFYFDEAKTQDTNTVVYGETCKLSYIDISGGCDTVYVGNDTKISKSPNINEDGVAEDGYDDYLDDDYLFVDHVSFDGADILMIDLTYGLETDYDYLYVFEGDDITKENWHDRKEDAATVLNEDGDNEYGEPGMEDDEYLPAGETTLFINGDSVSFVLSTDGADDYYGYYANIHPVYLNKPDGIQTKEDKICHFVKSDNVNEDGEKEESYYSDANLLQTVSIPGADKIKVEINYAINTDGAEIDVVRGVWNGEYDDYSDERMVFSTYHNDVDPAGSEEFIIDDGAVTFKMVSWDELIEGYDYGFYARLYPIYAEEHEGTIPIQDCAFGTKGRTYKIVLAPEYYSEEWYLIDGDDNHGQHWFYSEDEIINYILEHIDYYAGRAVDVYAASYYWIYYDANGGVPSYDNWNPARSRQWIGEFDSNQSIWNNNYFKKDGYIFVGWNTMPDGNGDWYYPGDPISSEGHLLETLTLYAQWGNVVCNPGATTIDGAVCLQDFTGPNHDWIISSMVPEAQYTLLDKRDNKSYTIAKLSAGSGNYEVWMTQNLDHDIDVSYDYNSTNTDIPGSWTPLRSTYTKGTNTWCAGGTYQSGSSYCVSNFTPESYDPGDLCWNGTILSGGSSLSSYTGSCGDDKHYHVGNYYNSTAAIAINDSSLYSGYGFEMDQSICPAGWRLPRWNNSKSYGRLVSEYNLTGGTSGNIQNGPIYLVYGGGWSGSSSGVGVSGNYWTSLLHEENRLAAAFDFDTSGNVLDGVTSYRHAGYSVRCVAR